MSKLRPLLEEAADEVSHLSSNIAEEAKVGATNFKIEAKAITGLLAILVKIVAAVESSKFVHSLDALKWKAKAARGKNKKIFGVPLERNSADLPPMLAKCLEYFAAKGDYY